jgi:hypothetical protein
VNDIKKERYGTYFRKSESLMLLRQGVLIYVRIILICSGATADDNLYKLEIYNISGGGTWKQKIHITIDSERSS